ncbi:MAG: hypothetical protein ABJF23_05860 [Bryobacteraceae bacterium]
MTSATAAQRAANQSNSRASTGPVTAEGKAKMRDNALRHGLTSKHVVITGESQEEFEALRQDLLADWKPVDTQEELLVNQIVESAWRLMRVRRIETRTYEQYMAVIEKLSAAGLSKSSPDPDSTLAGCFHQNSAQFDNIRRYEAGIERSYYRAIAELRKLQTQRKKAEIGSVSQPLIANPAAANYNDYSHDQTNPSHPASRGSRRYCDSEGQSQHVPTSSRSQPG